MDSPPDRATQLHRQPQATVGERADAQPEPIETLSPEDTRRTLHELQVRQIELEMQNEELRRTQTELTAGRSRWGDLHDLTWVGYCTLSRQGLILEANLTAATLLGAARAALVTRPISQFILREDQDIFCRYHTLLLESGEPQTCALRMVRPDGTVFWGYLEAAATQDVDGEPVCPVMLSDISEHKQAEEWRRVLLEIMQGLALTRDLPGFLSLVHDSVSRVICAENFFVILYNADTALFEEVYSVDKFDPPALPSRLEDSISAYVFRTGRPLLLEQALFEELVARGEMTLVGTNSASWLGVPLRTSGETIGVMVVQDYDHPDRYSERDKEFLVSIAGQVALAVERKKAEDALRESELKYRTLVDKASEAIIIVWDGVLIFANPKMSELLGVPARDLEGKPVIDFVWPEDRELVLANHRKRMADEILPDAYDFRIIGAGGGPTWVFLSRAEIQWKGKAATLDLLTDITERKQAEKIRAKLEAQLRQAQKMESVGRLAGGVAHDFNNMLGVILGHAEMALEQVDQAHPLHADLTEIRLAAQRSADLTRQLLAFARQQTIAPKVLDLNQTIAGMIHMLVRLIGEDIELQFRPGTDLWSVRVDPSQIDQVLANLCVNARDAIVDVGTIVIETGNSVLDSAYCADHVGSVPGEYLRLTVSDQGCGMDEETLTHLYEPFFTTKVVGQGTGLGLATAYGIVKQNDGFIDVYSQPGQGTTFTIYLPRHVAKAGQVFDETPAGPIQRGQEVILLAEDEPAILKMTARMLERQGYTVLAAGTPGEAIRLAQEHSGDIHLLMTDVVMPEMNGRELARNLLSLYPDIKRLFMSGYTADVIAHHGVLEDGMFFIQKPFTIQDLAAKVRGTLDGEPLCVCMPEAGGHPEFGDDGGNPPAQREAVE